MTHSPATRDALERWRLSDAMASFAVIEADTPELRRACHRLRYLIYCLENAFEDPALNPGGLEHDAYDAISAQALVVHKPTGLAAGTVRLILPSADPPAPVLPFFGMCRVDPRRLPLERLAEISRFGISRRFRRLLRDHDLALDSLIVALIRGCVGLAASHGVDYLCALLEPPLIRRVDRLGIHFPAVGPVVDYHGTRQPSIICIDSVLDRLKAQQPEVWAAITDRDRLAPPRPQHWAAE